MKKFLDWLVEWTQRLLTAKLPRDAANVLFILLILDLVLVSYLSAELANTFV